jgi:hypothetical protein
MGSIIKVNEYKDFNNNDIMTSDGSGNVTPNATGIKNVPTFRAYAGSAVSLANNADTTVIFDTESFDPQSTYDTSNGRFTPAVSGKYFLHANVLLSATNDQGIFDIYLKKNGSAQATYRARGSGTSTMSIQISDIVESDTDDYFIIQVYQNTGGSINASSGEAGTYFQGYKLIGA